MVLYIAGMAVESVELDLGYCKTYEHRMERISGLVSWLLYKYRASVKIKSNWEITLEGVESKMNEKLKKLK